MIEHTVRSYEEELKFLDGNIARMGNLAERMLRNALNALEHRDSSLAAATIQEDKTIDELERSVEELAIRMIARRQPMATDLRQIITAIKIADDLERIGDLAKNIAKRALAIASEPHPNQLMLGLKTMAVTALEQVKDVVEAYAARDSKKATSVWLRDGEIDAMYNSLFRELLTYMMEDPRNIGLCAHLLFGAKNIERIGDHATNIAEMIHYLIHGAAISDERPKSDTTSLTVFGAPGKPGQDKPN